MYICYSQTPNFSLPSLPPLVTISLFSMSVGLFLFCKQVHLYHFLDSRYKRYHMIFIILSEVTDRVSNFETTVWVFQDWANKYFVNGSQVTHCQRRKLQIWEGEGLECTGSIDLNGSTSINSCFLYMYIMLNIYTVYPWTPQVWIVQVHLYTDFFQ